VVRRDPWQLGISQTRWTLAALRSVVPWLEAHSLAGVPRVLDALAIHAIRGRDYLHSPDPDYDAKRAYIAACVEQALPVDYALLRGYRADSLGNVELRGSSRNFVPAFAKAARVAIVEVDEIVEVGEIPAERVGLTGILVTRVVKKTVEPAQGGLAPRRAASRFGAHSRLSRLAGVRPVLQTADDGRPRAVPQARDGARLRRPDAPPPPRAPASPPRWFPCRVLSSPDCCGVHAPGQRHELPAPRSRVPPPSGLCRRCLRLPFFLRYRPGPRGRCAAPPAPGIPPRRDSRTAAVR